MLSTRTVDGVVAIAKARQLAASGTGRMIRRSAGLSLAQVGDACGVNRSAVCRWESGNRRPSGTAAIAYTQLLTRLLEDR